MKFKDFLQRKFMKLEPQVLDDYLPGALYHWLSTLDTQEVIDYAEAWGVELSKEVREVTLGTLKG